ncbi:snRNA-activating protein complex subunit 1-like isoform X2 [Pomacea canaliculata]|uniref:snRNA-activating protein complex subunit 1-like isoform X2 n=1 Tax=Pomacea canaliculata TaxID=400727 RepID=UPI000D739FBC|nr:snRNA-activating protein complex subunit 1-like isoform X2 [Pomacea canaliculata]
MYTSNRGRRPLKNKKYAPATGIQTDFEKLLTSFVQTDSVRYEAFAKLWRERKFSLIYAGRQSEREVKEFVEEAMKIAVHMFLAPYGFQARVGALYLLYGLYYTQPCVPRVQIRMRPDAWLQTAALKKEIEKQNHYDTGYILNKLLADGAFHFCAFANDSATRYTSNRPESTGMAEALRDDRQPIDDLFTEEVMEQLSLVHTQYHQLKVRLAGPDAMRPDRSLDILHEKFPASVTDHLKKHHEQCQNKNDSKKEKKRKTTFEDESNSASSDMDTTTESNSTGRKRTKLRKLAFKGIKNQQHKKHRSLLVESPEKTESPKKRGRPKKDTDLSSKQASESGTKLEGHSSKPGSSGDKVILNMPQLQEGTTLGEQLMPGEEITNAKTEHSKRHDDEEHSVRKTQGPKKKVRMAHQVELGMLTKRKIGRPKSPKKQ